MSGYYRTNEELAKIIQFRQVLLNSARKRCEPLEQSIRESMGEAYPLGMTPENIANEIESTIKSSGYNVEMPYINLASSYDIERAIIEGQSKELMDALLLVAIEAENLSASAKALELYGKLEDYERVLPAKMREFNESKMLEKLEFQEEYLEMKEEEQEAKEEMDAAIKEDIDELKDAISEDREDLREAEKEERALNSKASKGAKIIKLPHKAIKESLGFDPER